jgi:hypothetical protein
MNMEIRGKEYSVRLEGVPVSLDFIKDAMLAVLVEWNEKQTDTETDSE